MNFVVIDVETANEDITSICQIGIATFVNGKLIDTLDSLVNPQTYFSTMNMSIHGINPLTVEDSPTIDVIYDEIKSRLHNQIVISHTSFDRIAIERVSARLNLPNINCKWLDSARVVRQTWPEFSKSGYGLSNLAQHFGIEYKAHDALQDALCTSLIFLKAVELTGFTPEEWLNEVDKRIANDSKSKSSHYPPTIQMDGNPNGNLYGQVVVFTGELSISRQKAAFAASIAGCKVDSSVTKHTTILVVGCQDLRLLAGHEKSTKHLKAEKLIAQGQHIRIMHEQDFYSLIKY